jgi:hypothetical protein
MVTSLKYLFALSLVVLMGCASTKQFVSETSTPGINAEKAVVTIERKKSFFGNMRAVTVQDNEKAIGELGVGGHLTWGRPAGDMKLTLSKSFGMVKGDVATVEEKVKTGETYKYYVEWSMQDNSFIIVAGK